MRARMATVARGVGVLFCDERLLGLGILGFGFSVWVGEVGGFLGVPKTS